MTLSTAFLKPLSLFTKALLLTGLLAVPLLAKADTPEDLSFDVYLDDKKIGSHHYRFRPLEGGYELLSKAKYKVKVFGITFFDYQHISQEVWRQGCLVSIDSNTIQGDQKYSVRSSQGNKRLTITTHNNSFVAPECVRTFGYWSADLIRSQQLLNSQTGELKTISHTDDKFPGEQRIKLAGDDVDIELVYKAMAGGSGKYSWTQLHAKLESGRTLSYRLANNNQD
ncbi:MAG: DUF6134 family protein [Cellvibrionaceae bacterium]|nr:DUF6134 family protein [Cellvibrionaceae bacterium]